MQQNILLLIISFLASGFAIVSSHYFVYRLVVEYLEIVRPKHRRIFQVFLVILPFIFLICAALSRFYDNFLVRHLYYLTGIWLGLVTMLTVFFLLYTVFYFFFRLISEKLNPVILGKYTLYLAIIISIFGVYSARNVQVNQFSLKVKNLPISWENKKILHVSDVHLGIVYGESFLRDLVAKINAQHPDVVVITGDLFDGTGHNFDYLPKVANQIQAKYVFFVNGNHEGYFGKERVENLIAKTKIKILNDQVVNVDGVQIVGIDFKYKINLKNQIKSIQGIISDLPTILLYHEPIQIEDMKKMGINFQLAGHTHLGQIFPFSLITKLIYGKYNYGLHSDQNYSIHTSSGVGTWGPAMRIGTQSEISTFTLKSDKADTTLKEKYLVSRVIDGDTIEVIIKAKKELVRLIGVDTPELLDPRKPVQCFAAEASQFTKKVLENNYVSLKNDKSQGDRDRYKRLLRYVILENGENFNRTLIENGYAHEYTYNLPYNYQQEFQAAEKNASDKRLGLWNKYICPIN